MKIQRADREHKRSLPVLLGVPDDLRRRCLTLRQQKQGLAEPYFRSDALTSKARTKHSEATVDARSNLVLCRIQTGHPNHREELRQFSKILLPHVIAPHCTKMNKVTFINFVVLAAYVHCQKNSERVERRQTGLTYRNPSILMKISFNSQFSIDFFALPSA